MAFKLVRVDDRLIHGQIVESWIPNLDIAEVVVVSDELVSDDTRCAIMRFATPDDIDLKIMSVEDAIKYSPAALKSEINILVLFQGLKQVIQLLDGGIKISELNIGGMHYSAGKNQSIGRAIFLVRKIATILKIYLAGGLKLKVEACQVIVQWIL